MGRMVRGPMGPMTIGVAVAVAVLAPPVLAKPIILAAETGGQIGVLCRVFDEAEAPATPGMESLCADAGDIVEQRLSGLGKAVVRFGILPEEPPGIDGPVILIAMETRPAWAGGEHPRILLRTMAIRDGQLAPSVGLPPIPVELAGDGWEERGRHGLKRMIDFILRDR
ncbi:hypothetical protein [Azospirillum doebereinerae]